MRAAHAGTTITDGEFDAAVADLVRSPDRFAVEAPAQVEPFGAPDGMRGSIVGR